MRRNDDCLDSGPRIAVRGRLRRNDDTTVAPADAGAQALNLWIPACAGMTKEGPNRDIEA